MDRIEDELWDTITNVLARRSGNCLDNVEERATVRDALYSTLVQTFEWKRAKKTD